MKKLKTLLLIIIPLTFVSVSSGIEKKIKEINSLPLKIYAEIYCYAADPETGDVSAFATKVDYTHLCQCDYLKLLFFDQDGRLRKEFDAHGDGYRDLCVTYYDENGDVIHYYYNELSISFSNTLNTNKKKAHGHNSFGRVFLDNGKIVESYLYTVSCTINQSSIADVLCDKKIKSEEVPHKIKKWLEPTAYQKLKKINFIEPPAVKGYFYARRPEKGDWTYTNAFDVLVRDAPGISSKVVDSLEILKFIYIERIDSEEHIKPWGRHHWYEVSYYPPNAYVTPFYGDSLSKGYVYGAFLEKVFHLTEH